jgi:hypothetical protein
MWLFLCGDGVEWGGGGGEGCGIVWCGVLLVFTEVGT